jgi:hypothetical protein
MDADGEAAGVTVTGSCGAASIGESAYRASKRMVRNPEAQRREHRSVGIASSRDSWLRCCATRVWRRLGNSLMRWRRSAFRVWAASWTCSPTRMSSRGCGW